MDDSLNASHLPISFGVQASTDPEQPGFGLDVLWNHPDCLGRPVLILHVWRWSIQVGWLADLAFPLGES